ncbi:hypothetical protein K5X82_08810 [Halosquirtibacter xylanolyticus]|uniref:hypothetical protein n=1 Tax=Halosquirtibacter xylanolyticus TaxID=3374599 RepID=UPI00374880C0|nr:hypothetical protein K5X82_08810 [Prolixibacteraceae bacterium]
MAIQDIYCSDAIFTKIVEEEDAAFESKTLFPIFMDYSNIILDLDEDELEEKIYAHEVYRIFNKKEVGELVPHKKFFQSIDEENYCKFPTDIFLLDHEHIDAEKIRLSHGCMILKKNELHLFEKLNKTYGFSFKTPVDGLQRRNRNGSWEAFLKEVSLTPINSAILIDSYLYKNIVDFNNFKEENLFEIVKNIIPSTLEVPFHITLVFNNSNDIINKEKSQWVMAELTQFIEQEIGKAIEVGIITHNLNPAIHERVLLTNHHYFYSDKGFNIIRDGKVRNETRGKIEWLYHDVAENYGTIRKEDHFDYLDVIRKQRDNNKTTGNRLCFNIGHTDNRLLS